MASTFLFRETGIIVLLSSTRRIVMLSFDEAKVARRKVIDALSTAAFRRVDVGVGIALPDTHEEGDGDYQIAIRVSDPAAVDQVMDKAANKVNGADLQVLTVGQPKIISPSRRPALPSPQGSLAIGMPIQRMDKPAGTLGFFARIKNDVGFISCNHVLTDPTHFQIGEEIFAPGQANLIGKLRHVAALKGRGRKAADCAFALVEPGQFPQQPGLLPDGTTIIAKPAEVRRGLPVIKFGRTISRAEGKIVACRMWRRIPYPTLADPDFSVLFQDVFEIESTKKDPNLDEIMAFSDPGDSGSPVCVNVPGKPLQLVGLLFAETDSGGPDNSGVAYANPITRVMRALFLDEIKA
jgi:hypothetical protein